MENLKVLVRLLREKTSNVQYIFEANSLEISQSLKWQQ